MQMARWFGYRPSYEDLCRVWITEEMCGAYQHALATLEDLRVDLKEMERQKLTPQQFGISVRLHPDALAITARNKMRSAALHKGSKAISLRGSVVESTRLSSDPDDLARNLAKLKKLAETVGDAARPAQIRGSKFVWRDVDKSLIAEFLRGFAVHKGWGQRLFEGTSLADFVGRASADDLQNWDLVVMGGDGERTPNFDLPHLAEWNPPTRTFGGTPQEGWTVSGKRMRILGPGDVSTTLSPEMIATAENQERAEPGNENKKSFADRVYTRHLEKPVLFVFPIRANSESSPAPPADLPMDSPLVAIAVVVPGDLRKKEEDKVEYLFNTVAQKFWDPDFLDDMNDEDSDEDSDEE
jgi:hypothetical protein